MQELGAAADERRVPRAVRIEERLLQSAPIREGADRRLADRRRFGEDLLHPRIGRERRALLDADRGQQSQRFGIDGVGRLLLDDLVHFLEERGIHRMDRVEGLAGHVDEVRRRRIRGVRQRIDPQLLLDGVHARLRIAVHLKAARREDVAEGSRLEACSSPRAACP